MFNNRKLSSHNHGQLQPGKVSVEHFNQIIAISSIRSERTIIALKRYLVHGERRGVISVETGVSQSTISVKIRQIQSLSCMILNIQKYYFNPQVE